MLRLQLLHCRRVGMGARPVRARRGDERRLRRRAIDLQAAHSRRHGWNMRYAPGSAGGDGSLGVFGRVVAASRLFPRRLLPVAAAAGVSWRPSRRPADGGSARRRPPGERACQVRPAAGARSEPGECPRAVPGQPAGDAGRRRLRPRRPLSRARRIGYIHFRNVVGKVPHYHEVFVDEGDIDMARIMRILKANRFEGVLIPDHTRNCLRRALACRHGLRDRLHAGAAATL